MQNRDGALRLGRRRGRQRLVDRQKSGAHDAGVVPRRLRAVPAVLGAPARLDAHECAALNVGVRGRRRPPGAEGCLGLEEEFGNGQLVEARDLLERPVMTDGNLQHGLTLAKARAQMQAACGTRRAAGLKTRRYRCGVEAGRRPAVGVLSKRR